MASSQSLSGAPMSDQGVINQIQAENGQALRTDAVQGIDFVKGLFGPGERAAAHAATTAAIGRGFQLTPEQIETTLTQAKQELQNHVRHLREAQLAERAVHSPGPDPASVANAAKIKQSLQNLQGRVESYITYWQDWEGKLTQAKQNYMNTEQINEQQWQRLAGGLEA